MTKKTLVVEVEGSGKLEAFWHFRTRSNVDHKIQEIILSANSLFRFFSYLTECSPGCKTKQRYFKIILHRVPDNVNVKKMCRRKIIRKYFMYINNSSPSYAILVVSQNLSPCPEILTTCNTVVRLHSRMKCCVYSELSS